MKKELKLTPGDKYSNKFGEFEVVEYLSWNKVKIRWLDQHQHTMFSQKYDILSGAVKNPFCPIFYGVGYYGFGDYTTTGVNRKIYYTWNHMLKRCYDESSRTAWQSYSDIKVCEDWHNYQNFARWYTSLEYFKPDWHLDKDIIIRNNKLYSPETCAFVPVEINSLFTKANKTRGKYCIGVHKTKKRPNLFVASCNDGEGKSNYLGCYSSEEAAFSAYKKYKEQLIKEKAEKFKGCIDPRVYTAMMAYEVQEDD